MREFETPSSAFPSPDESREEAQVHEQEEAVERAANRRADLALELNAEIADKKVVLSQINFGGVDIPYDKVQQSELPEASFEDLSTALKAGDYQKVLNIAFTLFFGNEKEVEALGYVSDSLDHLRNDEKANVSEQLYALDTKDMEYDRKQKTAILRSVVGYSLFRQGYEFDRLETPTRVINAVDGETVEALIRRSFPDSADGIIEEMKSGALLGTLESGEQLDADMRVACSSDGYPLYVVTGEGSLATRSVPLYRKAREAKAPEADGEVDASSRIEYLGTVIQPGDICFSSTTPESKSVVKKAFGTIGRMVQATNAEEEGFHAIHVLVCTEIKDGIPQFVHVQEGGGQEEGLDHLQANEAYAAITVGRMDVTDAEKQKFVDACREYAKGVEAYGTQKAMMIGGSKLYSKFTSGNIAQPDSFEADGSVCLDVVRHGASKIQGQEELAKKESALAMFKHLRVVESIEI